MNFKKVIVTSGPTREWIDPVRFISNASSGKMGFHIAKELLNWNENLVYIHGNVSDKYAKLESAKNISVESTAEMLESIESELVDSTLLVMAAAPADFRPKHLAEQKIKKDSTETFSIELEKNPDILSLINERIHSKKYSEVALVGFAAETENLDKNAIQKLERKGLDFIIGNYVNKNKKGFGDIETTVKIFSKDGMQMLIENETKEVIAKKISDFLKFFFTESKSKNRIGL